ncbi:unnamed protein product [marine sediment metagenome]|uniref:Class I SAM-dependent methyltransferase n=1 Tax=marine sediment metagenome TaxID=412755 RepID=X1IHZ9_9ZZZZ
MKLAPESRYEARVKAVIAQALLAEIRPLAPKGPIRMAEVGVKQGQLASRLLAFSPRLHLWLVDRWAPAGLKDAYRKSGDTAANAGPAECEAWHVDMMRRIVHEWRRTVILAMDSRDAATSMMDGYLHAVYLDADHTYEARLADLEAWTRKVMPGGLVAGGLWHSRFGGDGCQRAVEQFLLLHAWTDKVTITMGPEQTWWFTRPKT